MLGSDFYAGYNIHQRCWVHFLRDVHDLKDDFPQDEELRTWAKDVKAVYEQAVAWAEQEPEPSLSPRQLDSVRVAQQHVAGATPLEALPTVCPHDCPTTLVMRAGRTVFTRTFCVCCGAWGSCQQQPRRTQCPPSGHRLQNQWRLTQPQGIGNSHGPRFSFRHVDRSTSQSLPPVPYPTQLPIFFRSALNSIG